MIYSRRFTVFVTAVLALALPAAANAKPAAKAKSAPIAGQVIAAPTIAKGKARIPVLLSERSGRRLSVDIVRVVVSNRSAISVPRPDGAGRIEVKLATLRTGDAIKGRVRFTRRSLKKRVPALKIKRLRVTSRESAYSNRELMEAIKFLRGEISSLSGRLDRQIVETNAAFALVNSRFGLLETRMSSLERRMSSAEQRLSSLESQMVQLQDAMKTLEAALDARIRELEGTVGDLQEQLMALKGEVGLLTSRVDTLEATVGQLQLQLTALESRVNALDASLAALASSVGTSLQTTQAELDALSAQVTSVEENYAILLAAQASLQSQITDTNDRITKICTDNLLTLVCV